MEYRENKNRIRFIAIEQAVRKGRERPAADFVLQNLHRLGILSGAIGCGLNRCLELACEFWIDFPVVGLLAPDILARSWQEADCLQ